MGKPALER